MVVCVGEEESERHREKERERAGLGSPDEESSAGKQHEE